MKKYILKIAPEKKDRRELLHVIILYMVLYVFLFFIFPLIKNNFFVGESAGLIIYAVIFVVFLILGMVYVTDKLRFWMIGLLIYSIIFIIYSPPYQYGLGD